MLLPFLPARVKQCHDLPTYKAREICTFPQIAVVATPGKVRRIVVAIMLLGNDVLDMKNVGIVVLMNVAILAPAAGTLPDQASRGGIHQDCLRRRRALA